MITVEKTIKVELNDEECYHIALQEWNHNDGYKKVYKTFENWVKDIDFINYWVEGQTEHTLSNEETSAIIWEAVDELVQAVIKRYQQDHKKN